MAEKKKKRNVDTEEVCVKAVADLSAKNTLDQNVDEIVENRNEIVIHNIDYILSKHNISQAHMCNVDLGGTPQPPQLAAYKQVGRDIPFRTVVRIALAYGYTPEMMYGQLLDQIDADGFDMNKTPPRPVEEYRKYIGTYNLAYFATDAELGANKRSTARSIANGLLTVFFGNSSNGLPVLDVVAFANCTTQEQEKLVEKVRQAEQKGSGRAIRQCYEEVAMAKKPGSDGMPRMKCFYEGRMTLTDRIAEIALHQVKGSDVIHLNLHNRAANSSVDSAYKGGLATMMSISRGEEHMPCIQAVILSKRGFSIAKEELATHLFLEPPKVSLREETKAIIAYMKMLFPGEDAENPMSQLPEADKTFVLESYIEKKLAEVIKRNVLGYYKVSTKMDSDLYKAVCRDQ